MTQIRPLESLRRVLDAAPQGEHAREGARDAEHAALLAALARMGDAVVLLEGARLVWVSDAFVKMTGYAAAELTAPAFDAGALLFPSDPATPWSSRELLLRRKDGRVLQAEATAAAVEGSQPRRHVVVFRDLTARYASERSLREQRDIYDALLQAQDDLGEGVLLVRGSRIEYANDAFARIAGRPLAHLLGTDLDVATLFSASDDGREGAFASAPVAASHHVRTSVHRPDGARAHVEVASTGVVLRGEPYRILLVRDVTRAKQDAEDLETARLRLAMTEKLAALGSLVSGVAHEVRTPLTILATNAHVLERIAAEARETGDHARLAAMAPPIVESIVESVERANNLVKELRRFTQQQAVALGRIDFRPIVHAAVDLFQAANHGRARVVAKLDPTPDVLASPLHVQQIVINLLANAVEASAGAADVVRVRTGPSPEGGALLVVEDEGVGMGPDTKARMFEPLFTTKPRGTGLGLAIVKRIVDEHGAAIECDTAPGKGTLVRVRFPPAPAAPS